MNRIFKGTLLLFCGYLAANMLLFPQQCITAAKDAVVLLSNVVVPSLFPFFVCSNLFAALGAAQLCGRYLSPWMRPLFGIPGGGAITVILGIVSGYPVGAVSAAAQYTKGICTKTEAERMLAFCNNSGPLFVIGVVGVGMLHSKELGVLLYGTHILAALLTGVLFRRYGGGEKTSVPCLPAGEQRGKDALSAVGIAMSDSISAMAKVCGFVILFAVVGATLPGGTAGKLLYPLLEITGGIPKLLQAESLGGFAIPLVSAVLALSGVSVLMQVVAVAAPAGLSVKPYLLGKLVHAALAFLLTEAALWLIPIPKESALIQADFILPSFWVNFAAAGIGILWCVTAWLLTIAASCVWRRMRQRRKAEKRK